MTDPTRIESARIEPTRTEAAGYIDAHHHVWDLAVRDQPWTAGLAPLRRSFGIADLRAAQQGTGITATVLVQTITVLEETPEFLALAATEPLIAGVVGWVQLDSPDIADRLAELRSLPGGDTLVGIRHQVQQESDPRWLCRPEVRDGLVAIGEAGLAYDLLITADQLPAATETVRALPEVRFVLDHAGNPAVESAAEAAWRRDIRELSRSENVTVKFSGLLTRAYPDPLPPDRLRSWADELLAGFGPSRMMFGSDWPVCRLSASYAEVYQSAQEVAATLSPAERRDLFAGTATRTYRLAA